MKKFCLFFSTLLCFLLLAPVKVSANTIFSDNFTDSNGTTLQSHGPFVRFGGVSATIQSNQLVFPGDFGYYYYNNAISSSDYKTCFTIDQTFAADSSEYTLIYLRSQSPLNMTTISAYRAYFQPNSDGTYGVQLDRYDGGDPGHSTEVLASTTTSSYSNG
ncbi:MAG: hypothetical protein ABI758_06355 [Candidatus Woesebacteria bacterium]